MWKTRIGKINIAISVSLDSERSLNKTATKKNTILLITPIVIFKSNLLLSFIRNNKYNNVSNKSTPLLQFFLFLLSFWFGFLGLVEFSLGRLSVIWF